MVANVLRHQRFERVPALPVKRRRGPLPRGVVSIKSASRLRVGVLAEIVDTPTKANDGIRVVVIDFDPGSPYCWECRSLDRDLRCNDGAMARTAMFKSTHLRRLWTGLSTNDRIKLRMWRGA
jgi:hypothetical protein